MWSRERANAPDSCASRAYRISVVGDPVYGGRRRFPAGASPALIAELESFKRQALHAARLRLAHPVTGKEMEWEAPLPPGYGASRRCAGGRRQAMRVIRPMARARGVRSAFTLRTGGVSVAPYDSLNLGAHVGDAGDAVAENRRRVRGRLGLPAEPVWLQQVHGVGVRIWSGGGHCHVASDGPDQSEPLGIGASGAEAAARGGAAIGARGEAAAGSRAVAADVATGVATAAGGGGAAGSRDAVARVATGGATAARGGSRAGARDVAEISAAAGDPPRADAAVRAAGRVCVIQVADCMPVLFAARDGSAVGAAHAGWRGLAGGVLEATVAKLGVAPSDLLAWLGPTISQENFEVGEDVRTAFTTAIRERWPPS